MGCGSPLGDLFYLADTLLYHTYDSPPQFSGRGIEGEGGNPLRVQLYQMYGEGQVNEEVFTALRTLADRGQLRPADLAVHRSRAQHRSIGHSDPVTANALRGIRSRLTQLAQARSASEKVLADLEAQLLDINHRMDDKQQAARDALAIERDEESARRRLAEKSELGLSRDRLEAQVKALQTDLSRLEDLLAQLEAKSLELEAVQARTHLNEEMLK